MTSKLRRTAIVAIMAVVGIALSAVPAFASTAGYTPQPDHYIVPVGSIAGGLGVAAIAGIGLLVAQRRRRRNLSEKP
jgi:hypothetical protein